MEMVSNITCVMFIERQTTEDWTVRDECGYCFSNLTVLICTFVLFIYLLLLLLLTVACRNLRHQDLKEQVQPLSMSSLSYGPLRRALAWRSSTYSNLFSYTLSTSWLYSFTGGFFPLTFTPSTLCTFCADMDWLLLQNNWVTGKTCNNSCQVLETDVIIGLFIRDISVNCLHSKGVCVTDANKILFQVNDITTFMKEIKHLSDVTKRGNLH